jgi:parallel beta-helix repeat protein
LSSTPTGISATGGNNRIEDNNVTDNGTGIFCASPGNILLRNTASNSFVDYRNDFDTARGPIVTKFSGELGTTSNENHPWANFRY